MRFRIPDFPRGALVTALLFAIAWLAAFPGTPYSAVWAIIIAGGVVAWVLGSGWIWPSAESLPRKPPGQNYGPNRPTPDFAALIDTITAQGEANRQEEKREDNGRKFREWLTIFLLIGTVVLLNRQVSEMQKVYGPIKEQADAAADQIKRMDKQLGLMQASSAQTDTQIAVNKDLASAAKDQAIAAKEGANAVHENTLASQRAWVGPAGAQLVNKDDPIEPLKMRLLYRNYGRQPAQNLFNRDAEIFPIIDGTSIIEKLPFWIDRNQFNPELTCVPPEGAKNVSTLYPSENSYAVYIGARVAHSVKSGDAPVPIAIIKDAIASKHMLYVVYGCFAYTTFNIVEWATFCMMLDPRTSDSSDISQWQITYCPYGNEEKEKPK